MKYYRIYICVTWLLLQFVAFNLSCLINDGLLHLFLNPEDLWFWGGMSRMNFDLASLILLGNEALVVAVVGCVVLFRNEYGSKKFWKHCAVWYAIYLLLTILIILYESKDWGLSFNDTPVFVLTVAISLYPLVALSGLMVVITVAKWVNRIIKKQQP